MNATARLESTMRRIRRWREYDANHAPQMRTPEKTRELIDYYEKSLDEGIARGRARCDAWDVSRCWSSAQADIHSAGEMTKAVK